MELENKEFMTGNYVVHSFFPTYLSMYNVHTYEKIVASVKGS